MTHSSEAYMESGNKIMPRNTRFLARDIQCSATENYITKDNTGTIMVETHRSRELSSPAQIILQKTAHNALSLGGAQPHAKKGENLDSRIVINSNLHGLWVLKITYLDLSFNSGTCIFADGACKSKEFSSFEVTSKHENEKQKLLSISGKHLNIPFKSYDRKRIWPFCVSSSFDFSGELSAVFVCCRKNIYT